MKNARITIELISAAILGLAVIIIPVVLDSSAHQYDAAFLPVIRTAVEGMKFKSLILLIPLGAVFGCFSKTPFWLVGPATVVLLPLWSSVDLALGGSHNLLPIEWAFYCFYGAFGMLGASIGYGIKWIYNHKTAS